MNVYDLLYLIGMVAMVFYALSSLTIDFGNSVEEDWCFKYPNEYSSTYNNRLAAYSRISCNWNHHPTVGQVMQIKIRLFKNSDRGTIPHSLTESDEICVKIVSQNEHFEVKCDQDVRKSNGDVKNPKFRENEIIYSFVPQKAGLYNIYVHINGEKMFVCPIRKYFLPENELGIETTSILRGLVPFLCVSGRRSSCKLTVNLKDRFGNAINGNKIDISRLTWKFKHESSHDIEHIKGSLIGPDPKSSPADVVVQFEIEEPGIFHGVLLYKHVLLPNCNFIIVCVTQEEDHQITDVKSKAFICPLEYKATLLEEEPSFDLNIGLLKPFTLDRTCRSNCQMNTKKTEVLLLLTPSTIYIQDCFSDAFKSIPDIKYAFSINLNCKIHICSFFHNSKTDMVVFEMVNTESEKDIIKLEMGYSDLRTFVAIFSVLILNHADGEERFLEKHNSFFKEIQNHIGTSISKDRHIKKFEISRENAFLATLQCTKLFTSEEWKTLFIITLRNETMSYDKALRQWLQVSFKEMFQFSKVSEGNYIGLFVPVGETLLIHPHPGNCALSDLTSYQNYWKLIGQIIGKCIFEYCIGGYTGNFQTLNARFARSFLSQILGVQPNYKHFEKDDPGFYRSHICTILSKDVTHMNLYFEDVENTDIVDERKTSLKSPSSLKKVAIIRNGSQIKVTNENKLYYLNSLARFRLAERMKTEIRWILQGLREIIPLDSFFIFSENELELLLCGSSSYTIEDMLGYNSNYSNISCTEKKILDWYAKAVNEMSSDNRGRLLQFTTGSSILPFGCFSELNPPFKVEFIVDDDFGGFPTSNKNRINCICLRNHKNYETFKKSLISAINNGASEYTFQSIDM